MLWHVFNFKSVTLKLYYKASATLTTSFYLVKIVSFEFRPIFSSSRGTDRIYCKVANNNCDCFLLAPDTILPNPNAKGWRVELQHVMEDRFSNQALWFLSDASLNSFPCLSITTSIRLMFLLHREPNHWSLVQNVDTENTDHRALQ